LFWAVTFRERDPIVRINSPQWQELLLRQADDAGIDIAASAIDRIIAFVSELLAWNEKTNLTAITNPAEVAEKHIIDSLIPAKFIPENASVLDIGTGGGFSGIPLKILMPSLSVCLVDSARKKISFLKYEIRLLTLEKISAHQFRVEELSKHPDFAGCFDVVISRAFASLEKFLVSALPLIKSDGMIIAMKGRDVQKEIDEIPIAETETDIYQIGSWKIKLRVEKYRLPVSGDERALVMVRLQGEKGPDLE